MDQLVWIQETPSTLGRLEWLGAKTNWTPLEREVINRKGGTDEGDFKAYGTIAGSIGGAAACVATGIGAAVAVGCSILGGIIGGIVGGVVGKQVKIITGKSDEEQIAAYWNNAVSAAQYSGRGILAAKAYLTMREYALSLGYTEDELVKKGIPPAPISPRWKPSAERYEQAKKNYAYVQERALKGGMPGHEDDCAIAKSLGIVNDKVSCADFLYMAFWRGAWGPVSPPTDPIDFYAVGRDEAAASTYPQCDTAFPTLTGWIDTNVGCANQKPTDIIRPLIANINALPKVKEAKGLPPPASKKGGAGPVLVLGGLAAAGLATWYFFFR